MNEQELVTLITKLVQEKMSQDMPCTEDNLVPVGISNHHIHLSQEDFETLFGKGSTMTHFKDLSQPGQFACSCV